MWGKDKGCGSALLTNRGVRGEVGGAFISIERA
jgi:hypothetical protein